MFKTEYVELGVIQIESVIADSPMMRASESMGNYNPIETKWVKK